jgi:hypothetical protein
MKPSEKAILNVLRKSTLAYLTDVEFAGIEKAVERDGILNLTGISKSVLVEAVEKHQEHDQASHGSWAGTGAGGTSGGVDSMTQTSLNRGKKALEGNDYKAMMADYDKMETKWRKKLDKPFDPENEDYGDPQDLATTDFFRKYGAFPADVQLYAEALPAVEKANSVKQGDMVSWNSSGGKAQGKVVRVISSGKINVPDSSFSIEGTEDDPAALIQLYRDGKPTETKVGHKVSTLKKNSEVAKHGSHDQGSHGAWANGKYSPDDSEGEDESEPKNPKSPKKLHSHSDDSEEEYEELDADDPKWMDDMDILRPSRITPSQRYPK